MFNEHLALFGLPSFVHVLVSQISYIWALVDDQILKLPRILDQKHLVPDGNVLQKSVQLSQGAMNEMYNKSDRYNQIMEDERSYLVAKNFKILQDFTNMYQVAH